MNRHDYIETMVDYTQGRIAGNIGGNQIWWLGPKLLLQKHNIGAFKFGSLVRDRHTHKKFWQILIQQLLKQTAKSPNLILFCSYTVGCIDVVNSFSR